MESLNIDGKTPEQGPPMLYITSDCPDMIRTLPALQHDEYKVEDLDTDGEDHAADELRYACMSRPWSQSSPKARKRTDGKRTFAEAIAQGEKRQAQRERRI
jgi:hypothetical protein